ncbi:MAG TPA: chemotaxis protein CheW [Fibrobacteria bacterium]|nr:chemotaxis protein CheW [Fibrobacteria bacterium]
MDGTPGAEKAARMRKDFDHGFSLPAREGSPESEDLLAVRLYGDGYALRVGEITGVSAGRKILPLPGAGAALLGLAGIRGVLVPVWDPAALLGYPSARREPRWLVTASGEAPWALAFEEFDGYFRVPKSEFHRAPPAGRPPAGMAAGASAREALASEACMAGGAMRRVIHLAEALKAVQAIIQSRKKEG